MDYRFGPVVHDNAVTFRLYAPSAQAPGLLLREAAAVPMQRADDGFWSARVEGAGEGTRYMFRVGDLEFPDLASRQQDGDTSGWSVVRRPLPPSGRQESISPWQEAVFCEVHVGAATPEGTFKALGGRLEHFRDAGYTTLELMPVNDFPGRRNWGYDGTLVFAPDEAYGTPDELRALVDRAHELKLCIILDVVYNHFGEIDNFAPRYVPEWFAEEVRTPWGPGINFENPLVRQFYYENAAMWLAEYDLDGLRIDAVHEMKTNARDLFVRELALAARREKPSAKLVIENVENVAHWLRRNEANEPVDYTAQWNDGMHHVLNFLVTGERKQGYEDDSRDPHADLEQGLADGFVEDSSGDPRPGIKGRDLPPDAFVNFVQNHDQIGNRPDGKRLADRISAEKLDFVQFVSMLSPNLPLFFMGEEAQLRSCFMFFVDLDDDAAAAKRGERYRQMREMFQEDVEDGQLPDPNDPATFAMCKLDWNEYSLPERRAALQRFRQLAAWRRDLVWPLLKTRCVATSSARQASGIVVSWEFEAGWLTMALNPSDRPQDVNCVIGGMPVSTGSYDQNGETLRLGAWSAVSWPVPRS